MSPPPKKDTEEHSAAGSGDTAPGYTRLQRQLHWWVAALVAGQFLLQSPMREAMRSLEAGESPGLTRFLVTTVHVSGGLLIGGLVAWRWQLRRAHPVPVAGGVLPAWETRLIGWHHRVLYGSLVWMVITGVMHYFFEWLPATRWHELGKWVLGLAVAVHLLGVARHVLAGGQSVLARMRGDSNRR